MKILNVLLGCLTTTFSIWLFCGCSTSRPDASNANQLNTETGLTNTSAGSLKKDRVGTEHVFTNANVVMWVPSGAERIWDGHSSSVYVGEITLPDVFIHEYRICIEIRPFTEDEFKQYSKWAGDWYSQEHPTLSVKDVPAGKALRKTIRDSERRRILLIDVLVKPSDTFAEDVKTAKKMVESIKLIP